MLQALMRPRVFCVFAFLELVTVVYVWGELQFPTVYCGATRPLSLFYYPIVMSLLDLMKFNVYVAGKLYADERPAMALLSLLNANIAFAGMWVTVVLAVAFVAGPLYDGCAGCVSLLRWVSLSQSQSEDPSADGSQWPIVATANPLISLRSSGRGTDVEMGRPSAGAGAEAALEKSGSSNIK